MFCAPLTCSVGVVTQPSIPSQDLGGNGPGEYAVWPFHVHLLPQAPFPPRAPFFGSFDVTSAILDVSGVGIRTTNCAGQDWPVRGLQRPHCGEGAGAGCREPNRSPRVWGEWGGRAEASCRVWLHLFTKAGVWAVCIKAGMRRLYRLPLCCCRRDSTGFRLSDVQTPTLAWLQENASVQVHVRLIPGQQYNR